MKISKHSWRIFFLVMLVYGCSAKNPAPIPESAPPPPPPPPVPEFVETNIQPDTTEAVPEAAKPIIAKVTAQRLNLRKAGSIKGRILAVLKKGDELAVQMKKGRWVHVFSRRGLQGWVYDRHIKITSGISVGEALATVSQTKNSGQRIETTGIPKNGGSVPSVNESVVKIVDEKKRMSRKVSEIKNGESSSRPEKMGSAADIVEQFFLSILTGDMEKVKGFLAAGMSPNIKRPLLGHSPLFTAVIRHHDKIARFFIEAGGDVNFETEDGLTPLILVAGRCKSTPLVKALIDAGADVNAQAKGGETPLMEAEILRCNEILNILRKSGAQ